jgi:chemotaxis protein CheZ
MSLETKLIASLSELITQIPTDREDASASLGLLERYHQLIKVMLEADRGELEQLLGGLEGEPRVLFNEIGKLVRNFYEQMKVISSDIPERLGNIAQHDMEDAGQRLGYIVEMTENAANSTMDFAESLAEALKQRESGDKAIQRKIASALKTKNLPAAAEKSLKSIQSTLNRRSGEYTSNQQIITQILVAQSYQDLTGQTIQKIINLLASLETELVEMITSFAHVQEGGPLEQDGDALQGPQPESSDAKQTQGDVDNLLDALGF